MGELMIQRKKLPHWKDKKMKTKEYESETILGKLWDFVGNKIKEAVGADAKPKADDRIVRYIAKSMENKLTNLEAVSRMKRKTKKALERYLTEQEDASKKFGYGKEYNKWHDGSCNRARNDLILCEPGIDGRCLAAAILYQAATNRYPLQIKLIEFAWGVAVDHLCRITGDAVSDEKKAGKLPMPMLQEMSKVLFGRR
jgi:hypothetical protein